MRHGGGTRGYSVRTPRRRLRFDGQLARVPRVMLNGSDSNDERQMQTYPLDIDPAQVVRWARAEHEAAPSALRVSARRTNEVREIPVRRELHLGDEEREDLSEVATIATLEIAPAHASDGWRLTVVVEDEAGPRIPETGADIDTEQEIDLGTFYREFIRPDRGSATVIAEVEGSEAEARLTRLIEVIERNRHSPDRSAT